MSERGRVVMIFALVGFVALGAGFYFFRVYQPAQELNNAQQEVASWEARFQGVRDCLLGKTPGSVKTSEALAIREMAPDPWDRGKCTPLVSKLSRGLTNDTGIAAVETAWTTVDKAAQKAALAFATHVGSSTTLVQDPLPAALDALDAARKHLRAVAKLPPAEQAGKPLVAAQIIPIADGNDRVTELDIDGLPSAHGLVLFGKTESRMVQIVLAPGRPPQALRVGPAAVRSVPDTSWGAVPGDKEIRAGAFDAEGMIASPTSLKIGSGAAVAAVAGSPSDGVIVYGSATELVIANAKGAITAQPATKIKVARASTDPDGRIALIWTTAPGEHLGTLLRPGHQDAITKLPDEPGEPCMTSDAIWVKLGPRAISFANGTVGFIQSEMDVGDTRLQGCTPEAALLHRFDRPTAFEICTQVCRHVTMPPGAPSYATTTVVGGKLVAMAAHGGVLGVWHEGGPPTFYSLAEMAQPVLAHEWPAMALTDGKVIDVIARGDKTFVLIRIPAS